MPTRDRPPGPDDHAGQDGLDGFDGLAGLGTLVPLAGGWSGETYVADLGGEQVVVRIYARDPERVDIDAALLGLVRGLLPVPRVLEQRPADLAAGRPGLLITSLVPGVRGDEVLPGLDDAGRGVLGRALGDLVADLGGMPLPRAGRFVDGELRIGPFQDGGEPLDGLPDWVAAHEAGLVHLTPEEQAGLREVALDAQASMDQVTRTCLVHSDLNPKNLLVDPATLEVTAVLDWEYAHAGHPFTDLGNLLRFDREPAFVEAVLDRYAERRGVPPEVALTMARAADLWALVDLAARRHSGPVAARADRLLRAVARRRDPGAPEPG